LLYSSLVRSDTEQKFHPFYKKFGYFMLLKLLFKVADEAEQKYVNVNGHRSWHGPILGKIFIFATIFFLLMPTIWMKYLCLSARHFVLFSTEWKSTGVIIAIGKLFFLCIQLNEKKKKKPPNISRLRSIWKNSHTHSILFWIWIWHNALTRFAGGAVSILPSHYPLYALTHFFFFLYSKQ